jgi:hypothetical protein
MPVLAFLLVVGSVLVASLFIVGKAGAGAVEVGVAVGEVDAGFAYAWLGAAATPRGSAPARSRRGRR